MSVELRRLTAVEGWEPLIGGGDTLPDEPESPGYVEGFGYPIWQDERPDRIAHGTSIDPAKWNVRGSEVNNFDYAVVDPSMVYADAQGYMHLTAQFLPTPNLASRGGTVTANANDTLTCSSAHGLAVGEKVYIVHVSGGGIATGYYYVQAVPSATTLRLTADIPMWSPGAAAISDLPVVNVTANSTVELYRPRFMKTGYVDHRTGISGHPNDVQPVVQRYGRWEMRAKLPSSPTTGKGVLAAWWLRNAGTIVNNGPAGAEIDMMESWGSGPTPKTDPGTSRLTFFRYTSVPNQGTQWKDFWNYDDASKAAHNDAHQGFHVWAFEYMPTYFRAWRDGVLIADETPASSPEAWGPTFTNPFYMRLNLHMGAGAQYWGIPDPAHPEWTATPTDYVVDYVRVWKAPA